MSTATKSPPADEPVTVEEGLARLDDAAFVELLADLWERRGWSIEETRTPDDRCVELLLRKEWPRNQLGLVRVIRPSADRPVTGTDVRHFVRTAQREDVDWSHLVTPGRAAESVSTEGEVYEVQVVDDGRLADLIEEGGDYDLVGRNVDPRVAGGMEIRLARIATRLRPIVENSTALDHIGRVVRRRVPADPSDAELAELTFWGFRVAYAVAAGLFLLVLLAGSGSIVSWFLMAVFFLVLYGGTLPLMAADVYLVRNRGAAEWSPTWLYLAGFLFGPLALPAGAVYWYRRRTDGGEERS